MATLADVQSVLAAAQGQAAHIILASAPGSDAGSSAQNIASQLGQAQNLLAELVQNQNAMAGQAGAQAAAAAASQAVTQSAAASAGTNPAAITAAPGTSAGVSGMAAATMTLGGLLVGGWIGWMWRGATERGERSGAKPNPLRRRRRKKAGR